MENPDSTQDNGVIATPQENDMSSLTHAIIEWRRLTDEVKEIKQQAREKNKRMKTLEEVILRVMKNHNIGALDLKSSGGRVLFQKKKRQAGMGQKNMMKYVTEFMKSEQKAQELMTYIQEHREVVMKESLAYEKTE